MIATKCFSFRKVKRNGQKPGKLPRYISLYTFIPWHFNEHSYYLCSIAEEDEVVPK